VPTSLRAICPLLDDDLAAFGPRIRSEGELRHAVHRAPPQLVVDAACLATPPLEAALAHFRRAGAAVVLLSGDGGFLARQAERVLDHDGKCLTWVAAAVASAGRCLAIRVQTGRSPGAEWIRVPIARAGGAEAALAAARAVGMRVCESRIVYDLQPAR